MAARREKKAAAEVDEDKKAKKEKKKKSARRGAYQAIVDLLVQNDQELTEHMDVEDNDDTSFDLHQFLIRHNKFA
jgi:hypothetical protein